MGKKFGKIARGVAGVIGAAATTFSTNTKAEDQYGKYLYYDQKAKIAETQKSGKSVTTSTKKDD